MLVSDIPIEQCVGPMLVPAGSDPEIWPHFGQEQAVRDDLADIGGR